MSDVATTKRQRRSADETRPIILDAAVLWIEQNGTAGLKVVDVSRSCGVSLENSPGATPTMAARQHS